MRARAAGFIYVIEAPAVGLVKIGCTADLPLDRLREIQPNSPVDLRLVFSFPVTENAGRLEHHIHVLLDAFRKHGEWFSCSIDEAKAAIRKAHENRVCTPLAAIDGRLVEK